MNDSSLHEPRTSVPENIPEKEKGLKFGPGFLLQLLYVSIGLSAFIVILAVLFGSGHEVVGKSLGTVLMIVTFDVFVLLAFVARHEWLRRSIWLTSLVGMIPTAFAIWAFNGTYRESVLVQWAGRLMVMFLIMTVMFIMAAIISLSSHHRNTDLQKISYNVTIFSTMLSGVLFAVSFIPRPLRSDLCYRAARIPSTLQHYSVCSTFRQDLADLIVRMGVAAVIVALAALLIFIISNLNDHTAVTLPDRSQMTNDRPFVPYDDPEFSVQPHTTGTPTPGPGNPNAPLER